MERETKKITTPLGHEVEIKSYFTAGERGKVQRLLAGDRVAKKEEDGSEEYKVSDLLDAQALAVELAVVSIDGDKNDAAGKVTNNLPATEYDFIAAEVMALVKVGL